MAGGEDRQSGSAEEVSLVESRIDEKHLMSIAPVKSLSSNISEKAIMTKTPKDWIRSLFANSSSKKEAERRLAQIGLSMVQGLQSGEISLRQSQEDLFNLKSYLALRDQHSNRPLLEFVEWGMELEDVAELAPQGLQESYGRMTALDKSFVSRYPRGHLSITESMGSDLQK